MRFGLDVERFETPVILVCLILMRSFCHRSISEWMEILPFSLLTGSLPATGSGWRTGVLLTLGLLALVTGPDPLPAQSLNDRALERYESLAVRSPKPGAAFDRVYQTYFDRGDLDQLMEKWESAATDPSNSETAANYWTLLGRIAERRENFPEARSYLEKAVTANPELTEAWTARGYLDLKSGDLESASAAFEKALDQDLAPAERMDLLRNLAQTQQRRFDTEGALKTWKRLLEEFPDDPFVLEEVAEAMVDEQAFEEAETLLIKLRNSSSADPYRRVTAALSLARAYELQRQFDPAIEVYESALEEVSPSSWLARELRNRIETSFRKREDIPGLVEYYQKWLEKRPLDLAARSFLSDALIELGRVDEAISELKELTAKAPDRPDLALELSHALEKHDQAEEAIRILKRLAANYPEDSKYALQLGAALWTRFEKSSEETFRKQALEAWKSLIPNRPQSSAPFLQIAELLRERKALEESLDWLQQGLEVEPDALDVREALAETYAKLDQPEQSMEVLIAAWKAAPPNALTPELFLRISRAQERLGNDSAGLETLEAGLKAFPNHFDLLQATWWSRFESRNWDAAVELFPALLANSPSVFTQEEIESRHLRALKEMGSFDTEFRSLKKELEEKPDSIPEADLRLLARMASESGEMRAYRESLDLGQRRFPDSIGIQRLEVEYQRRAGTVQSQINALKRLAEMDERWNREVYEEIAKTYMEQGQWEKALEAARTVIQSAPADATAHTLYADICFAAGRRDEGMERLREALRWSLQPNEIRSRLADVYLEQGQLKSAREVVEEAFWEEIEPDAKLGLIRRLTTLYLQEGRLTELVERFEKRQAAESDGWRYGLYLAEIYRQTQDFARARKELSKSLLVRPNDPQLLRELIELAEAERNPAEVVRLTKSLNEIEGTQTSLLELAEAYLRAGNTQSAMDIVEENFEEALTNFNAWESVLTRLRSGQNAARLVELAKEKIQMDPGDWQKKISLAEFYRWNNSNAEADVLLWDLVRRYRGAHERGLMKAEITPESTMQGIWMFMHNNSLYQRWEHTRQLAGRPVARIGGSVRKSPTSGASAAQSNTAQTPEEARDLALAWLADQAVVNRGEWDQFLPRMDAFLKEQNTPRIERIFGWALMLSMVKDRTSLGPQFNQTLAFLEKEIMAQAETPDPELELDSFCLLQLYENRIYPALYLMRGPFEIDPVTFDRMEGFQARVGQAYPRLAANAHLFMHQLYDGIAQARERMSMNGDDFHQRAALSLQSGLDLIYEDIPQQVFASFLLILKSGTLEQASWMAEKVPVTGLSLVSEPLQQGMYAAPQYLFQRDWPGAKAAQILDVAVRLIHSGELPSRGSSRRAVMSMIQSEPSAWFHAVFNDLVSKTYLDQALLYFSSEEDLAHWISALKSQSDSDHENIALLGSLACAYTLWETGSREEALKMVESQASESGKTYPQTHLLHAALLSGAQRQEAAMKSLTVALQEDPDTDRQLMGQALRLRLATQLKDQEAAGAAGSYLVGSRALYTHEYRALASELHQAGLHDQASEIEAKYLTSAQSSRGSSIGARLQQYTRSNQKDAAVALARQILLGASPTLGVASSRSAGALRNQALDTLKRFDEMDAFLEQVKSQYDRSPNSLLFNQLLAEVYTEIDIEQAKPFYEKIIQLNPGDYNFQRQIAKLYQQKGLSNEAVELYEQLLAENLEETLRLDGRILTPIYSGADAMDQLHEFLINWRPTGSERNGFQKNLATLFLETGREWDRRGESEMRRKLWEQGLTQMQGPEWSEATLPIRQYRFENWLAANQPEQALNAMMDLVDLDFAPDATVSSNSFASIPAWARVRRYPNDRVEAPALEWLDLARKGGILEEFQERIELEASNQPNYSQGENPLGVLLQLTRIYTKDSRILKSGPESWENFLKYSSHTLMNYQSIQLIQEALRRWPEALELKFAIDSVWARYQENYLQSFSGQTRTLAQLADSAVRVGKTDIARDAMRKIASLTTELVAQQARTAIPQDYWSGLDRMVDLGMTSELEQTMQALQKIAQAQPTIRSIIAPYAEALDWLQGKTKRGSGFLWPSAMPSAKGSSVKWLWEVSADSLASNRFRPAPIVVFGKSFPAMDGRYQLIIEGAPSASGPWTEVATLNKINNRGAWSESLPESVRWIRGRFQDTGNNNNNLVLMEPTPAPASGNQLPDGWNTLEGWHGGSRADVQVYPGGPADDRLFTRFEPIEQQKVTLVSPALKLDSNQSYSMAGWFRRLNRGGSIRFGRQFLDSQQRRIATPEYASTRSDLQDWTYIHQTLRASGDEKSPGDASIPPRAEYIQWVIEVDRGYAEWAGWSLFKIKN